MGHINAIVADEWPKSGSGMLYNNQVCIIILIQLGVSCYHNINVFLIKCRRVQGW